TARRARGSRMRSSSPRARLRRLRAAPTAHSYEKSPSRAVGEKIADCRKGDSIARANPLRSALGPLRIVRPEHRETRAVLLLVDVALGEPLGEGCLGAACARVGPRRAVVAPSTAPAAPGEGEDEHEQPDPEQRDEEEQPPESG